MKLINHATALDELGGEDATRPTYTIGLDREANGEGTVTLLVLPEGRPDLPEQAFRFPLADLAELVAGNLTPPELAAAYGVKA
jgi:hypothetical protein